MVEGLTRFDSCTLAVLQRNTALENIIREDISVSLPKDLKTELDLFVQTEGISRSDLIREAVREYLFARQRRSLRQRLTPYAEAQGIYTDEDVFNEVS